MNIKTVLTIAGSDSSGGAGIQADIKTMTMNGVYAMSVITPNIPEAEVLSGRKINSEDDMVNVAREIKNNSNSHGTGCTLSSAIAANLAKGYSLKDAVENAKKYVTGALGDMMNLGRGLGPLNHGFVLKNR